MNLNKLIENTLKEKITLTNPQQDLREYYCQYLELTKEVSHCNLKLDMTLIDLEYEISIASLTLEINLFEKRVSEIKDKSPHKKELIESFEGTLNILKYLYGIFTKMNELLLEYRISRQRCSDLELANLKLVNENQKLMELNQELKNKL